MNMWRKREFEAISAEKYEQNIADDHKNGNNF